MNWIVDNSSRADWAQSKWICLSSTFFMIPAIYSMHRHYYHYSFLYLSITFLSINYWRDPLYSWRRNLDILVACSSCGWFTYLGTLYIRNNNLFVSFWTLFFVLLYCNHMSGKKLNTKEKDWWKYHFVCHLIEVYGTIVVIYSLPPL
jgi:hypothetical protein